ncbi:ROK family protein [Tropicimonas sp. TH_r6]|uniref:ROK family transcriptional regulator n=1 Tax=Tropicimonas sp. TH_r6 TaxID=3082085 RepID=UPI003988712E
MRAHNERLVLSMLRQRGPMPKAEIARATGLSAQTISVIMRGLERDGLLRRGDPIRGRVGQPSIPMDLAPDGAFFFGLKVGRRSADLILINFVGEVLGRVHKTHPYPMPDAILEFAEGAVSDLLTKLSEEQAARVAGLGIAIPFSLWDWGATVGAPAGEMDRWKDRDIKRELGERLSFPVYLENDATAACASELVLGTSDLPGSFLHFYIGYFIGGGLVLNNQLFTGASGNAGAIGPLPVPSGESGTRPLMEIASLSVLEQALQSRGLPAQSLWAGSEEWQVDETVATDWILSAAVGIAFASAAACSLVDIESVLIDGWMPASIRRRLVEETERALRGYNLTSVDVPTIREGSIGPDARALGAASLPLSERYLVDLNAVLLSR